METADLGIVITNLNGVKITELARSDYGPALHFTLASTL